MDIGNIAELNSFLVLDAIRSRGHVTRRQLGGELGLSDASVCQIVKRLLAANAEAGGYRGVGGHEGWVRFEDVASSMALRARAAEFIAAGQPSALGPTAAVADVFAAARAG